MSIKAFSDDFFLDYKDESELGYKDDAGDYIEIYKNEIGVFTLKAYLEVFSDKENLDREYVIINNTIIYLDTIKEFEI